MGPVHSAEAGLALSTAVRAYTDPMPASRSRNTEWRRSLQQVMEKGGGLELAVARKPGTQGDGQADLVWRTRLTQVADDFLEIERPQALGRGIDLQSGVALVAAFVIGQNRFTFHTEVLRAPLLDGRFDWVWGELEKHGIPAMVLFHHEYLHLLDDIAGRYPGLRLVLDHLGLKSTKGFPEATNFATLDKVLALARRPNVAAKVSALPCYADDKTWPFRSLHEPIRRVFDAFGPQRTFWGSDVSRLPCSYRDSVTMFTEQMPWLKGSDLEGVMGRGLCDWIGWRT